MCARARVSRHEIFFFRLRRARAQVEFLWGEALGSLASYSEWMDHHLAVWAPSLAPYVSKYEATGVAFLPLTWSSRSGKTKYYSILVHAPNSQVVVELISDDVSGVDVSRWASTAEVRHDFEALGSPPKTEAGLLNPIHVSRYVADVGEIAQFYEAVLDATPAFLRAARRVFSPVCSAATAAAAAAAAAGAGAAAASVAVAAAAAKIERERERPSECVHTPSPPQVLSEAPYDLADAASARIVFGGNASLSPRVALQFVQRRALGLGGGLAAKSASWFQGYLLETVDHYMRNYTSCWPVWGDNHVAIALRADGVTLDEVAERLAALGWTRWHPFKGACKNATDCGPSDIYLVDPSGFTTQLVSPVPFAQDSLPGADFDDGGFGGYCFDFCLGATTASSSSESSSSSSAAAAASVAASSSSLLSVAAATAAAACEGASSALAPKECVAWLAFYDAVLSDQPANASAAPGMPRDIEIGQIARCDPCATPKYVSCSADGAHVLGLDFGGRDLNGQLPDALGDLDHLTYLMLACQPACVAWCSRPERDVCLSL